MLWLVTVHRIFLTVVLEQRTSVGSLAQYCLSSSTMSQFSTGMVTEPLSGLDC